MSNKRTKRARPDVYERHERKCFYCGNEFPEAELSVDHVWPLYLGGAEQRANYVAACRSCNQLKGHLPPFFFMRHRKELATAMVLEKQMFAAVARPTENPQSTIRDPQ